MRSSAFFRCALFAFLLSSTFLGCSCEPKPRPCPCDRPEALFWLHEAQQDSLLDELVASGEISEDSREHDFIRTRISKDKKSAYEYFGDRMRDVGYEPGAFSVEPADPSQHCQISFVWSTTFNAEKCRWPGEPETGPFTETLWIRPAAGGIDPPVDPSLITVIRATIERESLKNGETAEWKWSHSGLFPAGTWDATIRIGEVTNPDCKGKSDRNVTANDSLVIQFEIGCFCENQEKYDVSMLTPPFVDHPNNNLQWNLQFPYVSCGDHPAEVRTIHEHMEIKRIRDGVIVDDWDDDYGMLMGSTMGRNYPLDSPKLEPGESYELTVELSGGDCGCHDEEALITNNKQSLTFSL